MPEFARHAATATLVLAALHGLASPAFAQAPADGTQDRPDAERQGIDLSVTVPRSQSDRLIAEDCEEEADAARIANEIVVCRQLGEASDGSWDADQWRRDYARRTMGEQLVDVAGGGIFRGAPTIGGLCLIPPCPPEAAIMIDIEALPEAPPGSDADRIARGLPPLGREEANAAAIAQRRRALGLDAPPVPGE
ncbi:hypothetical protein [Qipengyuania nanhaisediminis]|uniref:hypothetical protein n=1 Tax=Qipengyuania nanhaisediminis TaxID=604088 RepID=UPI0038B3D471